MFWNSSHWNDGKSSPAPCWSTTPGGALERGGDMDLFMYMIDVASGWIVAGSFESEAIEHQRILAIRERWDESQLSVAASLIRMAARIGAYESAPMVSLALHHCVAGATVTATFKEAIRKTGGVDGHWLVFVYTSEDAFVVANVVFVAGSTPGFLDQTSLEAVVRRTVIDDLRRSTAIGRTMARTGGALISPIVQQMLNVQRG